MRQAEKTDEQIIRTEMCDAEGYRYTYDLLTRESRATASYRLPLYSVRVTLVTPEGKETTAELSDVFADPGRAILFFDHIRENLATPIDLPYIFEDEFHS
ncbi:MAG TPA: hypothetical protein DDY70_02060 [Clostridiales bacterium]|nr:hypothetical protein [Clostridiales bacterium]